ncbi:Arc family DNA-binding protein [Mesorhizobium retamae]|uniref:Arc family DNA-binding protein n=1 Tax=Mesorhizobium retamae TaxID=2912854 RepID=A0ABS9QM52_9HYPH|nr:Arc family DNA-binding protein [Mesorhizobium sp. IRAMC:0171]MCG7508531.1 Arc family DNA-binding protein [Mesorhizobium sp. IRAMC:0171]
MARPGRGSDQFPLRLPDGLRDRIKTAAENSGRSMNAEIVRVLEEKFPEPWPLNVRIGYLTDLLRALRKVRGYEGAIDALTDEILDTVEGIASGRVPDLDEETRGKVKDILADWYQGRAEDEEDRSHWHERDDEAQT